jgi:hypothetical protein
LGEELPQGRREGSSWPLLARISTKDSFQFGSHIFLAGLALKDCHCQTEASELLSLDSL